MDLYKASQEELIQTIKRLRRQITDLREIAEIRNKELDALHYVWCDGSCVSGVHRHSDEPFTEDIVLEAEYHALRLRRKYDGMRWQIENWHNLPSTQTEYHKRHIENLKRKIAYCTGK